MLYVSLVYGRLHPAGGWWLEINGMALTSVPRTPRRSQSTFWRRKKKKKKKKESHRAFCRLCRRDNQLARSLFLIYSLAQTYRSSRKLDTQSRVFLFFFLSFLFFFFAKKKGKWSSIMRKSVGIERETSRIRKTLRISSSWFAYSQYRYEKQKRCSTRHRCIYVSRYNEQARGSWARSGGHIITSSAAWPVCGKTMNAQQLFFSFFFPFRQCEIWWQYQDI